MRPIFPLVSKLLDIDVNITSQRRDQWNNIDQETFSSNRDYSAADLKNFDKEFTFVSVRNLNHQKRQEFFRPVLNLVESDTLFGNLLINDETHFELSAFANKQNVILQGSKNQGVM